ncbi:MAG: FtsX-like permease family protein [Armatimonadetes bacterium]|nr:FtsX-like permease family protein [Armatimonadota bacterium]
MTPKGTLPFATELLLPGSDAMAAEIARVPEVQWAAPLLGTNLYVQRGSGPLRAAFTLGLPAQPLRLFTVHEGAAPPSAQGVIINRPMAADLGARTGDRVWMSPTADPSVGALVGGRAFTVEGIADFIFDLAGQRTMGLAVASMRDLLDLRGGEASFLLVKVRRPETATAVAAGIARRFPGVEAYSLETLIAATRPQLTYFNHFAVILGAVSLLVTFLLIAAILTLSLSERLGEIAVLRAIGVRRGRIVAIVLLEGAAIAVLSLPLALLLGMAVADRLDAILRAAPALPTGLHFFVLTPAAVARTVALLLVTGTLAAGYPGWVAGRLPIAATLHREIV